jgi:20S proteasome subunit beta 2
LNAISVLEAKFRDGLTEVEAIALCTEAIEAGIIYDLGSGSNVDVCVIKKDNV